MLRSIKDIRGYIIRAVDGEIGRVHEFYFDDQTWQIRYLVVDTGTWLPGRRVLIPPAIIGTPSWETNQLPVDLTRSQVEKSPPTYLDQPVSRQMETDLYAYYGWNPYWSGPTASVVVREIEEEALKQKAERNPPDPHLRSTREVIGYHLQAIDGEIGHIEDFIVDDEVWMIRYLVIDTRNWLPGKKVILAPTWVEEFDWTERKTRIDLHREMIEKSPEFDPAAPVNRKYEEVLYDYYGRPYYR